MSQDQSQTAPENQPESKYGFIIYRCTYAHNAKWNHFIEYISTQARARLQDDGSSDVSKFLDWNVQEDKDVLDGAGSTKVRELFNKWIDSGEEEYDTESRFHACIMVDEGCLDSIENAIQYAETPNEFDDMGTGFVCLVSKDEAEGETYIGLSYLIPRAYNLLNGLGWEFIADEDGGVALP